MLRGTLGRVWLVAWLYLIGFGHLLGALAMTWMVDWPLMADYHQVVLAGFGFTPDQQEILALHHWWMSLFGATLQAFAIFLIALVYVANRYRCAAVWLWLGAGILLWAPQDIYLSMQRGMWLHLWVDLAAVTATVPPLCVLWWWDRKSKQE